MHIAKKPGRKGFYDEQMVKKIVDLSNKTIYEMMLGIGRFAAIDDSVRIEIACRFALRAMPQKIESDGSFAPKTVVIVRSSETNAISRIEAHQLTA